MNEVSFGRVLNEFGTLAGLPLGDDGRAVFAGAEAGRFCARLNQGLRWLWFGALGRFALPEMMRESAVTLEAGGVIPTAALEGCEGFFSVWSIDPRAALPGKRLFGLRSVTGLGAGAFRVREGQAGDEVLVFARKRLPVWTVAGLPAGKPVRAGMLALCGEEVFRARVDDAVGDFSDGDSWEEVTLPVPLMELVICRADYERLKGDVQLAATAVAKAAECDELLEMLRIGAEHVPGEAAWLYNNYR